MTEPHNDETSNLDAVIGYPAWRGFTALTGEPWAIEPSYLPLIAALAQRNHNAPEVKAAEWQTRDFDIIAGPTAQRLQGGYRATVVDGVAVIPVMGPIFPRANMMTEMSGATSITMLQHDFRTALLHPEVGAILLLIDSPGGAVSGINSFADTVAAGKGKKPVVAHVAGQACSAAYWIASAASEISMERTGIVGSIGVVVAIPSRSIREFARDCGMTGERFDAFLAAIRVLDGEYLRRLNPKPDK